MVRRMDLTCSRLPRKLIFDLRGFFSLLLRLSYCRSLLAKLSNPALCYHSFQLEAHPGSSFGQDSKSAQRNRSFQDALFSASQSLFLDYCLFTPSSSPSLLAVLSCLAICGSPVRERLHGLSSSSSLRRSSLSRATGTGRWGQRHASLAPCPRNTLRVPL